MCPVFFRLEEMRVQAAAEAKAAAQAQVEEHVKKALLAEKPGYLENLKEAIMQERMKTEDQRLMVQLYVRAANTNDAHVCQDLSF